MKAEIINNPNKTEFKPLKIEIEIETQRELETFWHCLQFGLSHQKHQGNMTIPYMLAALQETVDAAHICKYHDLHFSEC